MFTHLQNKFPLKTFTNGFLGPKSIYFNVKNKNVLTIPSSYCGIIWLPKWVILGWLPQVVHPKGGHLKRDMRPLYISAK